jgi:serine/threonine-protein kinase RsbW
VRAGRRTFELPRSLHAASRGRRQLADMLQKAPESLTDRALLVLTELVTNSILHGSAPPSQPVVVRVRLDERALTLTVCDPGHGLDPAIVPRPREQGGWGLVLVERLSSRWGVRVNNTTCVWAEFDLPPSE